MHIHRRYTPFHPIHRLFYFYQSINKDCPSISAAAAKKKISERYRPFGLSVCLHFRTAQAKTNAKYFQVSQRKKGSH